MKSIYIVIIIIISYFYIFFNKVITYYFSHHAATEEKCVQEIREIHAVTCHFEFIYLFIQTLEIYD